MNFVLHVLVVAVALIVSAYFVPGIEVESFMIAIVAAVVLGLLNLVVRPVLFFLTLPVTILTLGLFAFVLNAFMFMFAAYFVDGFSVTGFIPALIGSLLVSVAGALSDRATD